MPTFCHLNIIKHQAYFTFAYYSCSIAAVTVIICTMRTGQDSVFISGTLHIVHCEGVINSPKVRTCGVLPTTGVPQHPEIENVFIDEFSYSGCLFQNLEFLLIISQFIKRTCTQHVHCLYHGNHHRQEVLRQRCFLRKVLTLQPALPLQF